MRDFVRRGQAMTARLEAFPSRSSLPSTDWRSAAAARSPRRFISRSRATRRLCQAGNQALHAADLRRNAAPVAAGRAQARAGTAADGRPFSPARALEVGSDQCRGAHDELPLLRQGVGKRITRHSPLAIRSVVTAVTRGLNMTIAEGLQVESEQFAAMVQHTTSRGPRSLDRASTARLCRPIAIAAFGDRVVFVAKR